jgi:NAD(P)-dependent dehydrogenase (short-subunit alcohol dehydrogenase family)
MTSFALMGPLAVFYSCAANGLLRLAAAAGIRSQQTQMQQIQQMPAVPGPVAVAGPASVTPLLKREGPRRLRVAIVTGCNTGIGFETARSLVLDHNVHVIMACRSRDKAVQAIEKIAAVRDEPARSKAQAQASAQAENNATGSEDIAKAVFVHPLDLSSFDSVKAFCAAVRKEYPAVDILVNNAGRNTNGESVSLSAAAASAAAAAAFDNSVDQQQPQIPLDLLFQSNFLGHFLLTSELLNADVLVPNARVVNLSSVMHHFCGTTSNGSGSAAATNGWESVDYWKQTATANCAPTDTYSPSKLAAQLFTLELNRRYGGSGSTGSESRRLRSIAVNPGAV